MNELLSEIFNEKFIKLTMSNKKNKSFEYKKVIINDLHKFYQVSLYTEQQVFHDNIDNDIIGYCNKLIDEYRQIDILMTDFNIKVLISKKGKISIIKKAQINEKKIMGHNKKKNYLIDEGVYIHWLYKLDIMDMNGSVKPSKQKKFKQINKFLENIEAIKHSFNHTVNIVDVGCGKSYLTFAIYHYLKELGYDVNILGIDLKEKVVESCQKLSDDCQFSNLSFVCANIFDYKFEFSHIDLMVGLHACDIATDYILYNAIKLNVNHILSVPCCQHEIKKTIKNNENEYMLRHGIFKERFAAMLTDSIRAMLLEAYGYNVVVAEFIEIEYTAKNILIKANKKNMSINVEIIDQVDKILKQYQVQQKLYSLLMTPKT